MSMSGSGNLKDERHATGTILVFIGPTLSVSEAQATLDATFLRPAGQGDVLLAAHAFRPRAMILIDGHFEDRPAVRHKEILWAMAQGIVMIGAASMGALRAAELYDFGMIGVGAIYRWYRRFPLAPDDAVAVQSGPAELGFLPLTDAMIDLRATFSGLMRRGLISAGERRELIEIAQSMNFRDRSLGVVLKAAKRSMDISELLRATVIRQKHYDASAALRAAPQLVVAAGSQPNFSWLATNTFIRDLEASGIDPNLLYRYR
jgi:hypothetical protein